MSIANSQALDHRPTPDIRQDQGPLLAQIPDLDIKTSPRVPGKSSEGRIISQALSIKMVFGVGFALVMGAILPFVFGNVSRPERQVKELPEWSNNGGSMQITSSNSPATLPTWPTSPASPVAAVPPQPPASPAPAVLLPQAPQFGDVRPAALTEPSWSPPRSSIAPPSGMAPAPNNYISPPVVNTSWPNYPVDPRNVQADNRNNVAAQYGNYDPRFDSRGNPVNPNPTGRDVPPGGYSRDPRYDNPNAASFPPPAGPSSALMPSGNPGPMPGYSNSMTSEPGVARFDGTIATPPVRTNYDRSGSGTN